MRSTKIALGTWGFSGEQMINNVPLGWPSLAESAKKSVVLSALEAGIQVVDTSDFYGLGQVETFIGRVLTQFGDRNTQIMTKGGKRPSIDRNGRLKHDFSAEAIRSSIDNSLRRLGVERIAVYQLHGPPTSASEDQELIRILEKAKTSGKIGSIGVSCGSSFKNVELWATADWVDSLQYPFLPWLDDKLPELGTKHRIGRSIFQHGFLLGKGRMANGHDHRSTKTHLLSCEHVDAFWNEIAPEANFGERAQLLLSYVLGAGVLDTVIVGATSKEQINQLALTKPLRSTEVAQIKAAAQHHFR